MPKQPPSGDTGALFDELGRARAAGNERAVQRATNQIVEAYLPLVRSVAGRIRAHLPFEDRVQEGVVGLYRAVESYDPARGEFRAYARPWVRAAIQEAICDSVVYTPSRSELAQYVHLDAPKEGGLSFHEVLGVDPDDPTDMIALADALRTVSAQERLTVLRALAGDGPMPEILLLARLRRAIHDD